MGNGPLSFTLAACLAVLPAAACSPQITPTVQSPPVVSTFTPAPPAPTLTPGPAPSPTPSLTPAPTPTPSPATSTHSLNIADGMFGLHGAALDRRLSGIADTGAKRIRFDVQWRYIEAERGVYRWSEPDEVMSAVLRHSLQPLIIITYAPNWAKNPACSSDLCGPAEAATYARFASTVVQHYRSLYPATHLDIELWNEANIPEYFAPAANPGLYVQMLCQGYSAVKAVDPNAVVITSGSAPSATEGNRFAPIDWLRELYNHGAQGCFDHVGHHPYTWPRHPLAEPYDAWGRMSEMHTIMKAHGDGQKQIWLTEYGYPTGPQSYDKRISEQTMVEYMTAAIEAYKSYPWAGPMFWYTYQDGGGDNFEGHFGLRRADGQPKAAYWTFRSLAASLNQ